MSGFTPAPLLNHLVGGTTSNDARLRLLERRLTGQDFDGLPYPLQQQSHAAAAPSGTATLPGSSTEGLHHAGSAPILGATGKVSWSGAATPVRGLHQQHQPLPQQPAQHVQQNCGQPEASTCSQESYGQNGMNNLDIKRRRTSQQGVVALGGLATYHQASLPAAPDVLARQHSAPVVGDQDCIINGKRKRSTSPMQGQAAVAPASNSPVIAGGGASIPASGKATPKSSSKVGTMQPRAGAGGAMKPIMSYFPAVDNNSRDSEASNGAAHTGAGSGLSSGAVAGGFRVQQHGTSNVQPQQALQRQHTQHVTALLRGAQQPGLAVIPEATEEAATPLQVKSLLSAKDKEIQALQEQLNQSRQAEAESQKALQAQALELSALRQANEQLLREVGEAKKEGQAQCAATRDALQRMTQACARADRELSRMQLAANAVRLGSLGVLRSGLQLQEFWEEGCAMQAVLARKAALEANREEVEKERKAVQSARRKVPPPPSFKGGVSAAAATGAADGASGSNQETPNQQELLIQEEIYKMRLQAIKREEEALKEEQERLNAEKIRHIRSLKRLKDEEGSRFNVCPTLGRRYVLMNMLGKGGFSEVYKAYDLHELRIVAAKIHQLNSSWSEAKKQSYVKHAIREYHIHKGLKHPNIVGLVDILEIDNNCFTTVLEYCDGQDLDSMLREHQLLPEKEARTILAQIFAGLVHMNTDGRRIIHYDLKPANIIFDSKGVAKITDFGLSKIVEEGHTQGLELTSQGAGTYWYLPPECFEMQGPMGQAPRISNKVDVWSAGVIFYQMLFGRRPFGHDLTQEQILRERVMLNAREVEFPAKPAVSAECKEFIRKCLTYRQEMRWDVVTAAQDPYLAKTK